MSAQRVNAEIDSSETFPFFIFSPLPFFSVFCQEKINDHFMQNAKISAKEYMEHEEIKREINQRERQRDRDREKETERQRDREKQKEREKYGSRWK